MKRMLFTLSAMLCITVASAQTDSVRTDKKLNKIEKSAQKATKKIDEPAAKSANQTGKRKKTSTTVQPDNSTEPNYRGTNPDGTPNTPDGTPANGSGTTTDPKSTNPATKP